MINDRENMINIEKCLLHLIKLYMFMAAKKQKCWTLVQNYYYPDIKFDLEHKQFNMS
jgi:hypothetical protein